MEELPYYYAPYPPGKNFGNPALNLLEKYLAANNWYADSFNFTFLELLKNRNVPILYFHWPESIWRSKWIFISFIKSILFSSRVLFAKMLGFKLVWSAHNSIPHEYNWLLLEVQMRKFILSTFHLIIGHANNTEIELREKFGNSGVKYVVAIHGHYENEYISRAQITRTSLGYSASDKIIYFQTNGKQYQNDSIFIEELKVKAKKSNIKILISCSDKKEIGLPVQQNSSVKVLEGFKTTSELADILVLCDFVALPYKAITTSGMYFLAATFLKPVIAPDLPFFKSHITRNTGLLYKKGELESIRDLIAKVDLGWEADVAQLNKLKKSFNWTNSSKIISDEFLHIIK